VNVLGIFLALLSGLVDAGAYLDYIRKVLGGKTTPNGATWAIWSAIALVNFATYATASGDFWKSIVPLTNIALCVTTFVLALCCGKFRKLDVPDWFALILALGAVVVWELSTAAYANMLAQFAIAIGFIPTWKAVRRDPLCEHPQPWWMWSSAYCVALVVVILRWRGQWSDVLLPVNCIILHASVPILASIQKRRGVVAPVYARGSAELYSGASSSPK
jgi:hypothetical protein